MRKAYSKPEIVFEDFTLSTGIAAGCEIVTNQEMYKCTYQVGRGSNTKNVFTSDFCEWSEGVIYEADGTPSYNGVCYHVPIESNNLFTS